VALVVLLRGVNVGGHRIFRPATLAERLKHLEVVNFGAAGTFVIRQPIGHAQLRAEFARRLPFDAHIMICAGHEIVRLLTRDFFRGHAARPNIVRFVSVLSRSPRTALAPPLTLPAAGEWLVRILAREGRFVVGVHRRHMKAIGCLRSLDQVFGAPATTRSWNTFAAIARTLEQG